MERRYILAGLTIIALAIVFIVYGIIIVSDRVVGVALSVTVIGVVFMVVGISYSEPVEDMLRQYIDDLNMVLVRLIEDMGIPSKHKLKLCYEQKVYYYSEKDIECSNIVTGVGITKGIPYIAIPAENMLKFVMSYNESRDLVDKLRNIFIDMAMVCRGISIAREGDAISIEFIDLTEKGFNHIKTPVNLLKLYILALVAHHFEQNVEVVSEMISQESYKITLKLEGNKYG
ncbi:MAG: hypothetical protein QXL96_07205 [Ignisphaera sp.]